MDFPSEHKDKVRPGHVLEWDPPAALTAARRWTCTECGDAVLINGDVVYGSATREKCDTNRVVGTGALL